MQKRKNIFILIVAVLCGLMGVILTISYVNSSKAGFSEGAMKKVICASQSIPENSHITSDMLQVVSMPEQYIVTGSYSEADEIIGTFATSSIEKGEQITNSRISKGEKKNDFAYKVPIGKRAISVAIDPIKGVSGFIYPGDKVDVLVTLTPQKEGNSAAASYGVEGNSVSLDDQNITFTLFKDIEVLAVDNQVNRPKTSGTSYGGKSGIQLNAANNDNSEAKTITLCLDANQAELIANAEKAGSIKFDLRNPGE